MTRSMIQPPAAVRDVVRQQRIRYEGLVEAAERYAAQGDVERVLRWAMLAANYAWIAPVGRLADRRLEHMVVSAVRGTGRAVVDGGRTGGRVLHVLSEAYGTGGHTRLAWRWIARDPRPADLALTNHHGVVPPQLAEAVAAAGGRVHELATGGAGLLDRAHALRRLMDRADLVVLHVHPHDSVSLAAVNLPGPRPPVIHEQHCDHMFWLGAAAADVVCDLREPARVLDVEARGIAERRVVHLPMPIDLLPSTDGAALRSRLGFAPDAVVAVTVSAQYKMSATSGKGMSHLLDRALHWAPQLCAVVVGTQPGAEWERLVKRYPGRVQVVGRVTDSAPYFAMADIYLDSYPSGSATSTLEAAVMGVPVVALTDTPQHDPGHMLQALSPGLSGQPAVTTFEQHAVTVRRLVMDAELRRATGEATRDAVLAIHDGAGWLTRLEALYDRARQLPAVDVDELAAPAVDDRYGAVLHQQHNRSTTCSDPIGLVGPLGELFDEAMQADLVALANRRPGSPVVVRVGPGWETEPRLAARLLRLAADNPHLSVSLPFAPGDDRDATATAALLHALLDDVGLTPDTCGDIAVETTLPRGVAASIPGELPMLAAAVDWLEMLVASPCWHPDTAAELVGS